MATIGWKLLTFNECPEAARQLTSQIEEARADLRKKGMAV